MNRKTYAPSRSLRDAQVKQELEAAITAQLEQLEAMWEERVPAINRGVRELQLDALALPD